MAAPWKAADDDSDLSHLEEEDSAEELAVQDPLKSPVPSGAGSVCEAHSNERPSEMSDAPTQAELVTKQALMKVAGCNVYPYYSLEEKELEAIKARVQEMEEENERPMELELGADNCLIESSETDFFLKMEADQRSIYVGNVDYGGTAEELESHFNSCGEIKRVTILCDKFSGHPKGYAYIEFEEKTSVKAAVELDGSVFRGRIIKVLPKRTNMPGLSTTDRGRYRGHFQARGGLAQWGSYYRGQQARMRGRMYRGRQRLLPWYFPY